jgi:Flp pilus assembly pilin Flp
MPKKTKKAYSNFFSDEDGLSVAEYLMLIGLIAGVVIVAILAINGQLESAWDSWADWVLRKS